MLPQVQHVWKPPSSLGVAQDTALVGLDQSRSFHPIRAEKYMAPHYRIFLAVCNKLSKLLLWGQNFSGATPKARAILWLPWGQLSGTLPKFPLIPPDLGLG